MSTVECRDVCNAHHANRDSLKVIFKDVKWRSDLSRRSWAWLCENDDLIDWFSNIQQRPIDWRAQGDANAKMQLNTTQHNSTQPNNDLKSRLFSSWWSSGGYVEEDVRLGYSRLAHPAYTTPDFHPASTMSSADPGSISNQAFCSARNHKIRVSDVSHIVFFLHTNGPALEFIQYFIVACGLWDDERGRNCIWSPKFKVPNTPFFALDAAYLSSHHGVRWVSRRLIMKWSETREAWFLVSNARSFFLKQGVKRSSSRMGETVWSDFERLSGKWKRNLWLWRCHIGDGLEAGFHIANG